MIETIFSPGVLQTLFGGMCTLLVTALFYAAKLKRADKDKLIQIIAELVLITDELTHNITVVSVLRKEAPEIADSCKGNGAVKQIYDSIRLDLIANSRVQLAKLGCELATIVLVTRALSEISTLHEAVNQAKALIAMPHIEQTATRYAVSRIQVLIDKNGQNNEPKGTIKKLEQLKTELESHIASYKAKLFRFDCEHPLFSYMWQFD